MGWVGRLLGGPIGDWAEDKIRGDSVRKRRKRRSRDKWLKPPFPTDGPINLPLDSKNGRGFIDTVSGSSVKPRVGSVLCCRLAGAFEHSGVYVGRGRIIHRDGDGFLASVTPGEFIDRLEGLNPALYVYVACDEDCKPVGSSAIANRARAALRNPRQKKGYNLLTKNCHHFTQYCITGDEDNGIADFTFAKLERILRRELNMDKWVKWEFD